jgi:hypothetical protein
MSTLTLRNVMTTPTAVQTNCCRHKYLTIAHHTRHICWSLALSLKSALDKKKYDSTMDRRLHVSELLAPAMKYNSRLL